MLSVAESADCVSMQLESAAVLSADAADAIFPIGVIPRKKSTETVEKSTSGNCA
jgi:hypothetical protein